MPRIARSSTQELWRDESASPADRAADLVSRMTLEEKTAQLVGVWVGADSSGGGVAPLQQDLAQRGLTQRLRLRSANSGGSEDAAAGCWYRLGGTACGACGVLKVPVDQVFLQAQTSDRGDVERDFCPRGPVRGHTEDPHSQQDRCVRTQALHGPVLAGNCCDDMMTTPPERPRPYPCTGCSSTDRS